MTFPVRQFGGLLAALLYAAGCLMAVAAPKQTQFVLADGFDYPVGKPDAFGYYKYRGFRSNFHLGEDWNGMGGSNSDLGAPVYNVAHGVVVYSDDFASNWGNVIVIRHAYRHTDGVVYFVDSLYGHLQKRMVEKLDKVTRGQQVGTIGTNRGMYVAHLHFEMRKNINVGLIHSRYSRDLSNYYVPSNFIDNHRTLRQEYRTAQIPFDTFDSGTSNRFVGPGLDPFPVLAAAANLKPEPLQPWLDPELKEILVRNKLGSAVTGDRTGGSIPLILAQATNREIPKAVKVAARSSAPEPGVEDAATAAQNQTERDKIKEFWTGFREQLKPGGDGVSDAEADKVKPKK